MILIGVHGQDQDTRVGNQLCDLARRFQAVELGHGDVHEHNIRAQSLGLLGIDESDRDHATRVPAE